MALSRWIVFWVLVGLCVAEQSQQSGRALRFNKNGTGQAGFVYHMINGLGEGSTMRFPEATEDQDELLLEFFAEFAAVVHHYQDVYEADMKGRGIREVSKDMESGKSLLRRAGAEAMRDQDRTTLEVFMGWIVSAAQKLPEVSRMEIKDIARKQLHDSHSDKFLRSMKELNVFMRSQLERASSNGLYDVYADIHVSRIHNLIGETNMKHVWKHTRR